MTPAPSRCTCCGKPRTRRSNGHGWRGAHNWCHTCTELWYLLGKPPSGPQRTGNAERVRRITATCRAQQESRAQDYAWLLSAGESPEQAAARVGVTARTARRYERARTAQAAAPSAA